MYLSSSFVHQSFDLAAVTLFHQRPSIAAHHPPQPSLLTRMRKWRFRRPVRPPTSPHSFAITRTVAVSSLTQW